MSSIGDSIDRLGNEGFDGSVYVVDDRPFVDLVDGFYAG